MSAPQVLDIYTLPLQGHTLIEASAGTGKTWTISGLYTRLLLDEQLDLNVDALLVVTFTQAATAELRDRIRQRLADVLDSFRQGKGLDEFCQQILNRYQGDPALAMRKLTRAVAGFDDAAIFTIHSFCQQLLAEAAFESGADFGLELLTDTSELQRELVEDFWRKQVYAVTAPWLDYLRYSKASPDRWRKLLGPATQLLNVHKLPLPPQPDTRRLEQQFAASWLRLQSRWLDERASLQALLQAAIANKELNGASYKAEQLAGQLDTLAQLIRAEQLPAALFAAIADKPTHPATRFARNTLLGKTNKAYQGQRDWRHPLTELLDELREAAEQLAPAYQLRLAHTYAELLTEVQQHGQQRKAERQQMSFDDLLAGVWRALQGPQAQSFIQFVQGRYRAALIDEFQDTDPLQCDIFDRLFAGEAGPSAAPLFYVGDPKQAIYGFRGADIHAYLAARDKVPAAQRQTLDTNQRSLPGLIDAVNALFDPLRHPRPFVDPGIAFQPVKASDRPQPALHIAGEAASAPLQFLLLPVSESGGWGYGDADRTATAGIANQIAQLLCQAQLGSARLVSATHDRPLQGGDIAVLVATHPQAAAMQQALVERGVASARQTRENVFACREAGEWLMLLQAIAEPARQGLVRTALLTELMGQTLDDLLSLQQNSPEWDAQLDRFSHWHALWQQHGFMRMFRHWLHAAPAGQVSAAERLLQFQDGERRLTNLLHLAELIETEARRRSGIEALLTWLARQVAEPQGQNEAQLMRLESDAQRVQIVTLHASKGLEYPIVFCPHLYRGSLRGDGPIVSFHDGHQACLDLGAPEQDQHRQHAAQEALEENLRLLYVALTRAKYRCYVVWGDVNRPDKPLANASAALKPGLHSAALSWLLHPLPATEPPSPTPLLAMYNHLASQDGGQLAQDVADMVARAPHAMASLPLSLESELRLPPAANGQLLLLAPCSRVLHWGWRVASFSGLTRGAHVYLPAEQLEAPDRDAQIEPPAPLAAEPSGDSSADPQPYTVFSFPGRAVKASVAGECVHAILENWSWPEQPGPGPHLTLEQVVEQESTRYALPAQWRPVLRQLAEDTVNTPVLPGGMALMQITPGQRLAEMEFTFPLAGLSVAAIQRLLADPAHGVAACYQQAAQHLQFESLQGYMRGYIDLVCQAQGRFYVLDYKTNKLGDTLDDYLPPALQQSVAQHHYYLQYLIYTVAVHRYLKQRLPGYDYDRHLGGVAYLFVRGMGDRSGRTGVHFDRLPRSLIEGFERLLSPHQGATPCAA